MMKRMLACVLALVMVAGLVPALAAGEANTFSPTVSPGLTEGETAVDTGIPGLTLTLGADEWSQSDVDIDIVSASGVAYTGFLTGKANPKPAEGTGTYFSFTVDDTVETGSLEIMYRLNAGKAFFILDNGQAMPGFDGMKLDVSADTSTTIIVEGGHTYTVYASGSKLRLYGCTFQNIDPKEVFAAEIAAFPFARIQGENADADHVDADLALMDSYESQFGSCDVSWTTDNTAVIDVNGTVNCQKTESKVALTGHFSVQENRALAAEVTFTVTVPADPDDASAVAAAREALTLGDLSSVKRNLDLPKTGKRGTAITWASSDETAVGADGKIYPANQADKEAVLTATVTRGGASAAKDFPLTVAGIVPVTLDSWVCADAAGAVRFTPVDGGSLTGVNITCNDPNPAGDIRLNVTVCGPDGERKAAVTPLLREVLGDTPTGKSVTVPLELAMDAEDHIEVTLQTADGADLIAPLRNNDALAEDAKVYVVGDSTASVYGDDRYPRKGWAQMLGNYFDGVEVVDLALSGRSSGSFKNEANYATLWNSIKPGDYLIIQFGHNDNKADCFADPAPDRFTDGSFRASMLEYVELAWEKGAKPVIATSISRRKLSDESLEKYVAAAAELAADLSIPCIDLYSATNGWINEVGAEGAKDMFNCVKPHDSRFLDYAPFTGSEFYEKGSEDDTHLNIYGADLIAQWAADAVKALGLPLAARVNAYRSAPLPSYAEATEGRTGPFADVAPGAWFCESVERVCEKGLFAGTGDGRFQPEATMSRAMLMTVLARMNGADTAGGESWYAKGLAWAVENGVSDGTDPEGTITREQLAAMLYRYEQKFGDGGFSGLWMFHLDFADADQISDWASEAMHYMVMRGVLTGKPGGLLDPQGPVTRAEAAAMLDRMISAK